MGLSRKIYAVFGMLLLMMGIIAVVGLVNTSSIRSVANHMYEDSFFEAQYFIEFRGDFEHVRASLMAMLMDRHPEHREKYYKEVQATTKLIDDKFSYMLEGEDNSELETQQAYIEELKAQWKVFRDIRDREIIPAIFEERYDYAAALAEGVQNKRFEELVVLVSLLVDYEKAEAASANRMMKKNYENTVEYYLIITIIGTLFTVVMFVYLSRSIIGRVKRLGDAMQEVEGGNFDLKIEVEGTDEISELMNGFNRMARQVYEGHVNQEQVKIVLEWNSQEMKAKNERLDSYNKELLEANDSIEKTREQMVQSEKMASIGQLAAGVAHEINNPIGFIGSNLNTLGGYVKDIDELIGMYREMARSFAAKDYEATSDISVKIDEFLKVSDMDFVLGDLDSLVRESKEGTDRVVSIVSGLKEFSHKARAEMTKTDLNHCIESVIKIAWNEIKYKANVEKDFGDLPTVMCRSQQVAQVFLNIIVNAAQAIEDKGVISIRTYRGEDDVFVEIADDGNGMSDDAIKSIFDPFFTTKDVGVGTGLGLSIAYGIINDHNGSIDVRSILGEGTVFTIRLPTFSDVSLQEGKAGDLESVQVGETG